MAGFDDMTLGYQRTMTGGGFRAEFCTIDVSNDVSASNTAPTRLNTLIGWVGMADVSVGCVTLHARPITNISLCTGPQLEISVGDISTGVETANTRLRYIVWGW